MVKLRKLGGEVSLTADHNVFVVRPRAERMRVKDVYKQYRKYLKYLNEDQKRYFKKVKKYLPLMEVPACELKLGDFLLYPIPTAITDLETINLKDYLTKSYTFGPRPPEIPYNVKIDAALLKLIGYWIAEGSSHRAYIRFSLGKHEEEFAQEIVLLIKDIFGIPAAIHKRNVLKTGLEISVCHAYLANIFENLCGRGAENKHIPFVFQQLPPEKQFILLNAIWKGDGWSFIANRSGKTHKAIVTISRVLAEQIVDVLLRNDFYPSFRIEASKIDKNGVRHKEVYRIVWSEEAKPQHNYKYYQPDGTQFWMLPIKEIRKSRYIGPVYNLTVEKDHSYVANSFAVANCGKGGDIFAFVKEIEGVEFGDALRILAQKAGVELKKEDPRLKTERKRLYDICELATRFFEKQLAESKVGQEAKQYLLGRGIKEESIKKWRIGYAPDSWSSLLDFLVSQGYSREEVVKAGLAIRKEGDSSQLAVVSSYFDRFRGRIMFPICDLNGQVVGFSGRIFKTEDTAKYVNTPNTLLYDKSRILYGLDKAKLVIRKADSCILVEGQIDAIMVSQAGYENVVATSGTALTSYQLKILKRYSENLLTAFDMDVAGDSATKRGIDLAQQEGFAVKVVVMPDGKDPADIIAESPSLFGDLLSRARSIMDFYFESTFARFDPATPEGKMKIAKILLPVLKRIPNAIELAHWRQKLAQLLRVREEDIEAELKKISSESLRFQESSAEKFLQPNPQTPKTRKEVLEESIAAMLLRHPEEIRLVEEKYLLLFSPPIRQLLEQLSLHGGSPEVVFASENSVPENLQYLFLQAESQEEDNQEDLKEEISLALSELWRLERRKKLREIALAIKEAEAEKARERVQVLVQEFHQLARELENF